LYFSPNIVKVMKSNVMGWTGHSASAWRWEIHTGNLNGGGHMEECINEIILKWRNWLWGCILDSADSGYSPMIDSCALYVTWLFSCLSFQWCLIAESVHMFITEDSTFNTNEKLMQLNLLTTYPQEAWTFFSFKANFYLVQVLLIDM
jgi:hypothetical protein